MPAKRLAGGIPGPVKLAGLCLVAYAPYHRTRWYGEGLAPDGEARGTPAS